MCIMRVGAGMGCMAMCMVPVCMAVCMVRCAALLRVALGWCHTARGSWREHLLWLCWVHCGPTG